MMLPVSNSTVCGHFSFGRLLIRHIALLGSHASRGADIQGAVDSGTRPGQTLEWSTSVDALTLTTHYFQWKLKFKKKNVCRRHDWRF